MWHNAFYNCVYVCCVSKGCNRQGCSTCSTCCHCRRGPQLKLKQELGLRMELRMKLPLAVCTVIKFFAFIIWCNLNQTETGCDSSFSYFFFSASPSKVWNFLIVFRWVDTPQLPAFHPPWHMLSIRRAACRVAPINGDFQWSAEFVFHHFPVSPANICPIYVFILQYCYLLFLQLEFAVRFWGICCDFSNF